MKDRAVKKRRICLACFVLLGFCAIEIPGIFFVCGKIYPFIFGLPFLYGYIICCWCYMCIVFFCGYRTGWGRHPLFRKK